MSESLRGPLTVIGRLLLCGIFFMSGAGNKIPNFSGVVQYMKANGVPLPEVMLVAAIVFLIVGSVSIILGFKARIGALMLAVFLVLATYYFHDFWTLPQSEQQPQIIQFMKNASMLGAMLMIMANGSGPWSLDSYLARKKLSPNDVE